MSIEMVTHFLPVQKFKYWMKISSWNFMAHSLYLPSYILHMNHNTYRDKYTHRLTYSHIVHPHIIHYRLELTPTVKDNTVCNFQRRKESWVSFFVWIFDWGLYPSRWLGHHPFSCYNHSIITSLFSTHTQCTCTVHK